MRNALKEIREKKGMTVLELSRKAGVSRQTIYNIEMNPAANISSFVMESIAKALGTKASNIFFM